MVQFKGSLTDGPSFNTNAPVNSIKRFATYTVGIGILFTGLALGSGVVAPMIQGWIQRLSGGRIDTGDSNVIRVG